MDIIRKVTSIIEGCNAPLYKISTNVKNHIVGCTLEPNSKQAVFSLYAKSYSGCLTSNLEIKSNNYHHTKSIKINNKWKRYYIYHEGNIPVDQLDIYLSIVNDDKKSVNIAFLFPQLESKKYASDPIPPSLTLPIINYCGGVGATVAPDRFSINLRAGIGEISSQSGSILIEATQNIPLKYLESNAYHPFFSLYASESESSFSVGVSERYSGAIVIKKSNPSDVWLINSHTIGDNGKFVIGLIFDRKWTKLFINGSLSAVINSDERLYYDTIHLGSEEDQNGGYLSGTIQRMSIFHVPLQNKNMSNLSAIGSEISNNLLPGYIKENISDLDGEYDFAGLMDRINDDEFLGFLSRDLRYTVEAIGEQFPPSSNFIEENIRDWAYATLRGPNQIASREDFSKIGRSDLRVQYNGEGKEYIFLAEFKIWGRQGYKELPTQPIKYMKLDDDVGVIFLIDRRKRQSSKESYREILRLNSEYPLIDFIENRILELPFHYILSVHKDSRREAPRLIVTVPIIIPDQRRE